MFVEIAVVAPDQGLSPFVIARLADRSRCPVLARPLHARVSDVVAGMEVVLVHSVDGNDLRTYGPEPLVRALTGIALAEQRWMRVEVPDGAAGGVDTFNLAA